MIRVSVFREVLSWWQLVERTLHKGVELIFCENVFILRVYLAEVWSFIPYLVDLTTVHGPPIACKT